MLSRAKSWLRGKDKFCCCGLEHATYVSSNVVLLVTPDADWSSSHVPQLRKWLQSVHAKHQSDNTMVFVAPCSGIQTGSDVNSVFRNCVHLGRSSHFNTKMMAPELKLVTWMCQAVSSWICSESNHVAVIAVSRERAALLCLCITAYVKASTSRAIVNPDTYLAQYEAMCQRLGRKYDTCTPIKAHEFFLKHWVHRVHNQPAVFAARLELRDNNADEDDKTEFYIKSVVISGALGGQPHEILNHQVTILIARGEGCVYSSMGSEHNPNQCSDRSTSANLTFPVNVKTSPDADLFLKIYKMNTLTTTREIICTISIAPTFAQQLQTPGQTSLRILAKDIEQGLPSHMTVTTYFEDRALLPPELRDQVMATSTPSSSNKDESKDTHTSAITARQSSVGNDSVISVEEEDAAFALSLQRQFDLEALRSREYNVSHPESEGTNTRTEDANTNTTTTTTDTATTHIEDSIDVLSDDDHHNNGHRHGDNDNDNDNNNDNNNDTDNDNDHRNSVCADVAVNNGVATRAMSSQEDTDDHDHTHNDDLDHDHDHDHTDQLAADEAFARALQAEFEQTAFPPPPPSTTSTTTTTTSAATSANNNNNSNSNNNSNNTTTTATTPQTSTASLGTRAQSNGDDLMQRLNSVLGLNVRGLNETDLLRMLVQGEGSTSSQQQHQQLGHRRQHAVHPIHSLPCAKVGAAQFGLECEICYEPYDLGETFRMLPCMHRYHKDCIDPWLLQKHNPTCPVCNTPVSA